MSDAGDESGEGSGAEPDEPTPTPPHAVPVTGRAAQFGTLAVALIVLLVVGVAWFVRGDDEPPTTKPPATSSDSTEELPTPSSDAPPSTKDDDEGLPEIPDVPASLCPDLTLTTPISVVTFNIHSGRRGRGLHLDQIASEIKAWKPDVVLLQEVDDQRRSSRSQRQAEVLGGLTDMSWVYGGNNRMGDGGPVGNAILSKYKIVESENIALPRAGGRQQRGLLHAVLDVKGTEISFYATHFDHISGDARLAQARAVIAQFAKDPRPKVLGGDLNARADSAPLRVLRSGGLGDSWAAGKGAGNTAPARRPRIRIDFVLHDGWFRPLKTVVLASRISDHRAVWTRIEFREDLDCFEVGAD